MTFTNEEMARDVEVLSQLRETGRLGYAIARNLHKLRDEVTEYVQLRDELLTKYGRQVQGAQYQITGDNVAKYREELGDLPEETTEVNVYTVPEDVFTAGSLDSAQMEALLWMVVQ